MGLGLAHPLVVPLEFGEVFRTWQSTFLGGFSQNIGYATGFEAELLGAMFANEKSVELNWNDIWL